MSINMAPSMCYITNTMALSSVVKKVDLTGTIYQASCYNTAVQFR